MRYSLVRLRSSPRWYIQWFEDGHSRRASTGTADRDQAEAVLAAFRLERDRQPSGDVSLAVVLDWYLETRGKELARKDSAELAVKYLKAFFGSTLADDVNLSAQDRYAANRRKTVGNETIRRELSVLSAAMRRAVAHEKIAKAPAILSIPKSEPRERWLTRDEAAKLLRHLRKENRAKGNQGRLAHLILFTRLALYTGARSGAILDLTWDRVHLDRTPPVISYPVPGRRRTNKRAAVVPIEANVARALRHARRTSKGDHIVAWRGEKVGRIVRAFTRHAKAAGLGDDVTPHTLRHTYATWAALAGVPLFLIGRSLGQSMASTTERYAKHQPNALLQVTRAVRRK